MPAKPFPVQQSGRKLTIVAWVVTVLISVVPDIFWSRLAHAPSIWLNHAKMILLVVLALTALFWKPLRPLRNFFVAMFAFFVLFDLRLHFSFTWPALQDLFGKNAFDIRMQAEQTGKLAVSLGMIGVLLLLGLKRRDLFLVRGDLRTPIEPVRWLGFLRPVSWVSFGLQWSVYISVALVILQYSGMRPSTTLLLKVVPILPSILFYASLNAFNEEIAFRVPMLATLESVTGSRQALLISAYFFGIAHYFGVPGGIVGGIASIFMGWILGKGILETRGLFWSWWIHFLSDVAIFTFLAIALLK